MIKSILEDEDPPEDSPKKKRGLFGKHLHKKEVLSIGLTEDDSDGEELPGETEEEIRNGILGITSPDPSPPVRTLPASEEDPAPVSASKGEDAEPTGRTAELEKMVKELEEELRRERGTDKQSWPPSSRSESQPGSESGGPSPVSSGGADPQTPARTEDEAEPMSKVEAFRRMGLAWSAAIAMFGSVVFMLAIGWIADVLLGSSPWGIVTGVVIGAAIGFFQLFRISSQITGSAPNEFEKLSLRSSDENPATEPGPAEGESREDGERTA